MILYAKHLILMSIALFLVPLAGRLFARAAGLEHRFRRPGLSLGFLLSRLLLALAIPLLAQGLYDYGSGRWFGELWLRFAALAVSGGLYGALFGDAQDFPRLAGAFWGVLGGLGAAWLYVLIPPSGEGRALCVALFAVLPLLAYRLPRRTTLRRISAGGMIVPDRRTIG